MTFPEQESSTICILAANGGISTVPLRQPKLFGITLTYKGRFEIRSLSGSFMPIDNGAVKSIAGGMSPDGRFMGGEVAGLLIAVCRVQVVIGSFLTGYHQEPKPMKQIPEFALSFSPVPATYYDHAESNSVCYTGPLRSITPGSDQGKTVIAGNHVNGQSTVAEKMTFPCLEKARLLQLLKVTYICLEKAKLQ